MILCCEYFTDGIFHDILCKIRLQMGRIGDVQHAVLIGIGSVKVNAFQCTQFRQMTLDRRHIIDVDVAVAVCVAELNAVKKNIGNI